MEGDYIFIEEHSIDGAGAISASLPAPETRI
jgi:hypothetical protein